MLTIKKLEFSDCFSYGSNNIIDFTKNRVSQLQGQNGAGKSSLIYILQEALTSKNSKKITKDKISNRNTPNKGYYIKVYFTKNNDDYTIEVSRKNSSSTVNLTKNGIDISEHKIPDTYKKLNQILEDTDLIFDLIYKSSNSGLEFLSATDSKRKEFLINLFNLSKYVNIYDTIKINLQEQDKQLNNIKGQLKTVEDFLNTTTIPEKVEKLIIPIIDSTLKEKIIQTTADIQNINKLVKDIDRNNKYKQERENLVFNLSMEEIDKTIKNSLDEQLNQLNKERNKLSNDLSKINKDLNDLDVSDFCYACKRPLDNLEQKEISNNLLVEKKEITEKLTTIKNTVNDLSQQLDEWNQQNTKYMQNMERIEKFEHLSAIIDPELPDTIPSILELKQQLNTLNKQLEEQEKTHNETVLYNNKVDIRNTKIDALIEQKQSFLAKQQLLLEEIHKLDNRINLTNILKKSFSNNGIVAYKIENYTKIFEEVINNYLTRFSDGQFQLIFRLQADKLNIIIINDGIECDINSLSTGELSRVQFSVLLGIRKILSDVNNNSVNLLFLDEVTGVLDTDGKDKLTEILSEEDCNTLLVMHDYSHPLINKIYIEKENNISRIIQ